MGFARTIGGLVLGGVAVFGGVSAFQDEAVRNDDGTVVDGGGSGVFVLQVGDCIQLPESEEPLVQSVENVPCSDLHDAQLYTEVQLGHGPNASFPGGPQLDELALAECLERWPAALGRAYDDMPLHDADWFVPSAESWADFGDREVQCFVVRVDGQPMRGSRLND